MSHSNGEQFSSAVVRAREDVRRRMSHGDTIDDVDAEIIEPSDLNADEKAALWLYAWSFVPRRSQRKSAELHLRLARSRA
jgi:hypothetical protein